MQRFQYDLGSPATARSNLDAAIHLHFIGNAICIGGTILQLQITMDFCRPHMYQKKLKPQSQCGTDPTVNRWNESVPRVLCLKILWRVIQNYFFALALK